MILRVVISAAVVSVFLSIRLICQQTIFPFSENFDSVAAPKLPPGWSTTSAKSPGGDFTTVSSTSFSPPNALVSTDSKIAQSLTSPAIDFSGRAAGVLQFYERRTSTHNSGILVEASVNGDTTFALQLGDTLKNPGNTNYLLRSIQLPSMLNNQQRVHFRWRVVGNGTGSTGTVRLDNVMITVQKVVDLALTGMQFQPAFARNGETISVRLGIVNRGLGGTYSFTLQLFDDRNADSVLSSNEKVDEESFVHSFAPAESIVAALTYPSIGAGNHRLVARLNVSSDEDTTNNSLAGSLLVGYQKRAVIVNEIMYAPSAGPEWVECVNNSSDTLTLAQWKIGDNTSSRTTITSLPTRIPPKQFLIITKDSSIVSLYPSISVPIIKTSFAALNNDFDAVVIADPTGFAVDSVAYNSSWGGSDGRSLERVDTAGESNQPANWETSRDPAGATPGLENSVAKKDLDLSLTSVNSVLIADGMRLSATVRNIGRSSAGEFTVRFYHDADRDSVASTNELIYSTASAGLAPDDSMIISFDWRTSTAGKIPIICSIEYPADQRLSNNSMIFLTSNKFHSQSAVINEVMFEPLPNMSEFIELYNRGTDTLDLQGWKIMDAASLSGNRTIVQIANTFFPIPPDSYLVVAADSTIAFQFLSLLQSTKSRIVVANKGLSLNNASDDIILIDQTGAQIDSVRYSSSWHNPSLNTSTAGRSLERVNPGVASNDRRNWSTSVATPGATPGQRNSIYTPAFPSNSSMTLSPNPFSPDDDGFEDILAISYSLPTATSMVRVRCFDVVGRLIRTIANNEPVASSGTIFWNGHDDQGRRVRIGMYIILFEALDGSGGVVHTMKDVAVVATKLSR